jgi:hypothetical protein
MSPLPTTDLEIKAARERERLHSSVLELRSRVRESLDMERQMRENLRLICSVAALVGLASGYAVAGGFFVGRRKA